MITSEENSYIAASGTTRDEGLLGRSPGRNLPQRVYEEECLDAVETAAGQITRAPNNSFYLLRNQADQDEYVHMLKEYPPGQVPVRYGTSRTMEVRRLCGATRYQRPWGRLLLLPLLLQLLQVCILGIMHFLCLGGSFGMTRGTRRHEDILQIR